MADPDCEALVEYLVLGPIAAAADGRPLTIGAGKQRTLLAILVMHANTAVSVDRIIDALWGERPPASAAKVVQVLISQLRKALANGEEPSVIMTVGGGYMLRVDAGMTDVDQFDQLVETGRNSLADGNPREAELRLSEALGLWRGRAYEDVSYEEFAREEIRRLDERRAAAMEERCEAMLADGRHADAVADLEKLAAEHPLRERVLALWMLALYRAGRRAEALSVYDTARRRLADELGIEPGERLTRLHAAMLQADEDEQPADALQAPGGQRRSATLLFGAAALLLLAAAAALAISTRGTGGRIGSISGDSVGLIDPVDGHIIADYPTGQAPTVVLARGDHAWTIDADSQTVSRVGSDEARHEQAVPGTPAALAWAAGSVWVSYSRLLANGRTASAVLRLDPDTLQPLGHVDLPQSEPTDAIPFGPLAVVDDHLWLGEPAGRLTEIDPTAMRVLRTVKTPDVARALAVAGHTLWVLRADGVVTARDGGTGQELGHFALHTPHPLDIVTANGLVWVSDGFTGEVWRIDPGPPIRMSSVSVGASAVHLAGAGDAVWATDSVGGTLSRISAASARPLTVDLSSTPVGVAVSTAGVWTTVAGGGGLPGGSSARSAKGLPLNTCGRVVYGGHGAPDVIIADDLALDTPDGTFATLAMAQAAEYALRLHRYQAGRFRVGLQICNDATTGEGGYWDPAKCSANARAYATTPKVVAVLAPYNSGCTAIELPILNRAAGGPVPVISQANDYAGLTQKITGTEAGEPRSHYPSGVRNMVRAYPSDIAETAADAKLAARLGARRVLVSLNPKADNWETSVAYAFARASRAQGMKVIGPHIINRRLEHTVERLIRHGVDGVFLAGWMSPHQINVLRSARRMGGPRLPIITWNGWIAQTPIFLSDVPESRGTYISGGYYTNPEVQLPTAGRRFMAAFAHTAQADTSTTFAPYAAQAMDIALTAIAHSDGTRQSVLRALFNTHIPDGILGDIRFHRDGDLASVPVAIYRIPQGPTATLRPYTVLSITG